MKKSRCSCGKVKSKYLDVCTECFDKRMAKIHAEIQKIVQGGICPICGAKIKRNYSITGWYQCEQLGADNFRKDPSKPSCCWQGFTE